MDVINLITGQGLASFIIVLVVAFVLIFGWLMMLVDCAKRKFSRKALWLILLILFSLIAAWFYYFLVKRKGTGASVKKEDQSLRKTLKESGEPVKEPEPKEFLQVKPYEKEDETGKTLEELQSLAEEEK